MKIVYIPKEQRIIPPWIKGPRPWVVIAKLIEEEPNRVG